MPNLVPEKQRDIVFSLDANLIAGAISALVKKTPGFSIEANTGAQLKAATPGFAISADITSGAVWRLSRSSPGFTMEASATVEDVMSGSLKAPGFRSVYGILEGDAPLFSILASLSVEAPAFSADNYAAYAMNLKNDGMTDYSNFPFEFMARFEGEYYGFNANGAYLLEGVTDAGTNIDCRFALPPLDFGTSKHKRLNTVYVGCDSAGKVKVAATVDEDNTVSVMTKYVGRNRRATIPKGLSGRFWSVQVENVNGNSLKVDEMELLPTVLRRKV